MHARCARQTTPRRTAGLLLLLLLLPALAAAGCSPPLVPDAAPTDLSGAWTFESGWLAGTVTLRQDAGGDLAGQGRMTASPLEGIWQAREHDLTLTLDNTCPIQGAWRAGSLGGGLRGFTTEEGALTVIQIRLTAPYVSPRTGPGERLAGTLLGTLATDGAQFGGLVREVEGRLGGGSLAEAALLLERQTLPAQHPLTARGIRTAEQVDLAVEVTVAGECEARWHFTGTLADADERLAGTLSHPVYGTLPLELTRE